MNKFDLPIHKKINSAQKKFKAGEVLPKIMTDGWGKKVSKTQIEALAVAECMTNNKKEKCFIYAINDEVVWK